MFQEIASLFQYMTLPIAILLIVGVICVVLEIFQPGVGIFGILGGLLLLGGVIWRIALGHGNPIAQFFILLFLILLVLISAFLIMLKSAKRGWLSRSSLMSKDTAVDKGISDGTRNYVNLVDKTGVTVTDLKPTGKAIIEDVVYDVTSDNFYLPVNTPIRVVSVEGVRIVVKTIE